MPAPHSDSSDQSVVDGDLLILAEVTGAYGIKGWIKLRSFTEVAENLFSYDELKIRAGTAGGASQQRRKPVDRYSGPQSKGVQGRGFQGSPQQDGGWRELVFEQGRAHGKGLIALVQGVSTREAAEALRGSVIAVPKGALAPLRSDEFYWHQLEGLRVLAGECNLGRVAYLMETGANDVLVVRPLQHASGESGESADPEARKASNARERLIPWLWGDVVQSVDLDSGIIQVNWDPEF
ncbi:MAG: ribosome maturation factor RimM [Pseudomonadota bacterium]